MGCFLRILFFVGFFLASSFSVRIFRELGLQLLNFGLYLGTDSSTRNFVQLSFPSVSLFSFFDTTSFRRNLNSECAVDSTNGARSRLLTRTEESGPRLRARENDTYDTAQSKKQTETKTCRFPTTRHRGEKKAED